MLWKGNAVENTYLGVRSVDHSEERLVDVRERRNP